MMPTRRIQPPQLGFGATWPPVRTPGIARFPSLQAPREVLVRINGVEIVLLPNEFAILKRLVQAEGRVVPLRTLSGEMATSGSLQGVMSRLRQRLKPLSRINICQVIGNGYALSGITDLSDPLS